MSSALFPGLLVSLPFLGAAIVRVPGLSSIRFAVDLISILTALATAAIALAACSAAAEAPLVSWVAGWAPRDGRVVGIALVADRIATGFIALAALATAAALLFAARWYEAWGSFMHTLTLTFLGGLVGFVLAGDLLTMFVFLELLSIASYALTGFKIQDDAPVQAAFNVAVVSTIGASLFLVGAAMIYALTGTPNLAEAASMLDGSRATPGLTAALSLLLIGLAVKSGLLLFHFAHVDSESVTPAPLAGLFSAVQLQVGVYALARFGAVLFQSGELEMNAVRALLIAGAVGTAIVAALLTIMQEHLKRVLAFSSVAHVGIAAAGVALSNGDGYAAAAVYIAGHAPVTLALFLVAGLVLARCGSMQLDVLAGRGRREPMLVGLLVLGALMLAGLPPAGLYAGKSMLADAAGDASLGWLEVPLYAAAALTGAAVLRAAAQLWRPATHAPTRHSLIGDDSQETLPGPGAYAAVPLTIGLLATSLLLTIVVDFAGAARDAVYVDLDRGRYVAAVTGAGPTTDTTAPPAEPVSLWRGEDLAKGAASALAALLIAVFARRTFPFERGVSGALRRWHSGRADDYVAWLTVGAAVVIGWLFWA